MLKTIFFILLFAGFGLMAQAQSGIWNRADRAYRMGAYTDAVSLYEEALKQSRDEEAMRRLAECYEMLGNTQKAAVWYGQLAQIDFADPKSKKKYADILKRNGNYQAAKKWYENWGDTGGDPADAARHAASCAWAQDQIKSAEAFTIKPGGFNSIQSDISPVYYEQGLVFSSNRERGFGARVENIADGGVFYDLYFVDIRNKYDIPAAVPLKGKVNAKLHDGPAAFEKDGNVMYFTKSHPREMTKGPEDKNKLCVVRATKDGKKWRNVEALPFNMPEYSCGHPALSHDSRRLYFSSDSPGGFGGADLYVAYRVGTSWSTPENLGPEVNTSGDEMFPYVHEDDILFFASDGHIGFGGLDIFYTSYEDKKYGEVLNAGFPMNSSGDDFAVTFAAKGDRGYFTSDRPGGVGSDDIYEFERRLKISGTVTDLWTKMPLEGVKVKLLNARGGEKSQKTDEAGSFEDYGKMGVDLFFIFTKDGYEDQKHRVTARELSAMENVDLNIVLKREAIWSMSGHIVDAKSGQAVVGAKISYQGKGQEKFLSSDEQGRFMEELSFEGADYDVMISKPGYVPVLRSFSTTGKIEPQDFRMDISMQPGYAAMVIGSILNKSDGRPVTDASVASVSMKTFEQVNQIKARGNGTFRMVLMPGEPQYLLASNSQGFFSSRWKMPFMEKLKQDTVVYVRMELVPQVVGATAKVIYFDYNKSDLRKESKEELFDIINFMKDNPNANVELSSHTDSRGSLNYNEKLSQRRADAAVKFIVKQGIEQERITAKGYGKTKLLNRCKEGVQCPDAAHAENRRCELTVTGISE